MRATVLLTPIAARWTILVGIGERTSLYCLRTPVLFYALIDPTFSRFSENWFSEVLGSRQSYSGEAEGCVLKLQELRVLFIITEEPISRFQTEKE